MSEKKLEQVFFGLIEDLKNYLDHLVLVGGWLPWLYTQFLWKVKKYSPVMTQDIDIGVKEFYHFYGENITDCLLKRNYFFRSVCPEEPTPIQFILKDREKEYPIDFITGEWSSPEIIQKITGKNLYVSSIDYFEFLFKHIIKIECNFGKNVFTINTPTPAAYFFHKAVTFIGRRENSAKHKKDIYYLYYILDNMPNNYEEIFFNELSSYKIEDDYFKIFKKNIRSYFKSENSKGPSFVAEYFLDKDPYFKKYVKTIFTKLLERLSK